MPPRGVKKGTKRARQYEQDQAEPEAGAASRSAAPRRSPRGPFKRRRLERESRDSARARSTQDISSGRRGGQRSGSGGPRGQTREQLYNEAKRLNIEGRSRMNKRQLLAAVNRKKS